jgi:hypothetical protein
MRSMAHMRAVRMYAEFQLENLKEIEHFGNVEG